MKRLLKVIGIISVIFIAFIGILSVYNQIAIKAEAGGIVPNGQMIELGEYSVHVYSEGEAAAAPTLVFMSGSATVAPVYDFKSLYSLLSDEYRVAVIEKAGYGYSDIAEVDRDIATLVEEDRNALNSAGLNGPYVLLPHSMSGLEAIRCAQMAQIHEFVNALPLRYETHLDENGSNLSGGQRQRIAIARAMLKKPEILILDEATSNLDAVTEKAIQETLDTYSDGMTTIIIAHRLSTIRSCDTIFVMEKGRILESGSHDELMGKENGVYRNLYRAQTGE